MPTSFTPAQIERLKLQAKITARNNDIVRAKALDSIAHSYGFSNWSLLMKHATLPDQTTPVPKYFRFSRTNEAMHAAFKKVKEPLDRFVGRHEEAERLAIDIWDEFGSASNAVDFAVDYMSSALQVPRFHVHSAAVVYWEMRHWLPYEASELNGETQILVNRRYKPVGKGGRAWVNYGEYKHLNTHLTKVELLEIAHRPQSEGYLYNDGTAPWLSRDAAEKYLSRLKKLQKFLNKQAKS